MVATGATLKLNRDSTYFMETCGNHILGLWQLSGDSLLLFCRSNRFRIDSLNRTGFNGHYPSCGDRPEIFIRERNILKSRWEEDSKTVLADLEKIN